MNIYALTPVELVKDIYFKREDLCRPFSDYPVNGTKLRQCYTIVENALKNAKNKYKKIATGCSIHSPQASIVSVVGRHFGLLPRIYYGDTDIEKVFSIPQNRTLFKVKAEIIFCKCSRSKFLYRQMALQERFDTLIIKYGMNLLGDTNLLFESTAKQVENIPDNINNLVITCGSGNCSIGVLYGIHYFKKNINKIVLIGVAPNRVKLIRETLGSLDKKCGGLKDIQFEYIDLFNTVGFEYSKKLNGINYENINFHPNYEAKTFNYAYNNGYFKKTKLPNLFWIVGNTII